MFADIVLSILQSPILKDLDKAIRIYKTDCDIRIAKTI